MIHLPLLLLLGHVIDPPIDPQLSAPQLSRASPAATVAAPASGGEESATAAGPGEDDDEDDGEEMAAPGELETAHEVEAKALSEEERLRRERLLAPHAVGPGSPLWSSLDDLPDVLPQIDEDAREATQILHELEQFETFDAEKASERYDIPVELNDQVSQYIRAFQGPLRSHFVLWLARSARYIPAMRTILEREGVPSDTVFLSLIESGFSTLAYSVARAAGQWQFISSTGKRFGLRNDFWVDERRDPERATLAAAQYLKELRGQLGSWYLAWAGYNAGAGSIFKAIRRQHSTDFWQLIRGRVLRKETKGYVPKLIAAALIAKHPHAFGFDDIEWQKPVKGEMVEVGEPTELSFIADAAGTDLETLRDLNPGLRRFCTPPPIDGRPYAIRVPEGTADRVAAAVRARPASDRLAFRYHKVQAGEGLGVIARSYGVAPEAIARLNGLHRQAVKPGRELVIPVARGMETDAKVATISDEREGAAVKRHGRWRRSHRGPTGWVVSDDCQDPFAKGSGEGLVLEPEPPLGPAKARRSAAGTASPTPVASSAVVAAAAAAKEVEPLPADASRYLVIDGDTLWTIAQAHNLSLEQLCAWNHIAHPSRAKIFPGEKLWVRGGAPVAEKSVAAPWAATPSAAPAPSASSYTIRDGDNLWTVAKRLGVRTTDLIRWNGLDEDSVLQPGQVLKVGE